MITPITNGRYAGLYCVRSAMYIGTYSQCIDYLKTHN